MPACLRSAAVLLHAACCMLHPVLSLYISSPATQLCDRGDLGKPSVIDKDIPLLMMDMVHPVLPPDGETTQRAPHFVATRESYLA